MAPKKTMLCLYGIIVLLAGAFLAVMLGGTLPSSQAAPAGEALLAVPVVRHETRPVPVLGSSPLSTTTLVYLPSITREFKPAWLAVSKTATPSVFVADPAQVVTYTVTISNQGDTAGSLLTVVDTLPDDFVFESMASGSDVLAAPDATTGTITWAGPWGMAPGQQMTLAYRVLASQVPGYHANQVSITAQGAGVPPQPASATVEVQPRILMQENFDAGISRWMPFLNYHRLEPGQWYWGVTDGMGYSGALTHNCCVGTEVAADALMMYLQPGAQDWTDYRVETRMYLTGGVTADGDPEPNSGDPIGLWIRGHYQESEIEAQWVSGYYVVVVGKSDDPFHLVRIAKMQQPGDCEACLKPERMYNFNNPIQKAVSPELPGPFEHYRWYKLAVEVRGANIQVFLDGQPVLNWTDPTLPYLSGTVGFKVHETKTASFDDIIVTRLP